MLPASMHDPVGLLWVALRHVALVVSMLTAVLLR
jgi:hypothetical protein